MTDIEELRLKIEILELKIKQLEAERQVRYVPYPFPPIQPWQPIRPYYEPKRYYEWTCTSNTGVDQLGN